MTLVLSNPTRNKTVFDQNMVILARSNFSINKNYNNLLLQYVKLLFSCKILALPPGTDVLPAPLPATPLSAVALTSPSEFGTQFPTAKVHFSGSKTHLITIYYNRTFNS